MSERATSGEARRIELSADSEWLGFRIGGHDFDVEIFEASDVLAENDRRFMWAPDTCLDCGGAFVRQKERPIADCRCPSCESSKILPDQTFLDGVATLLRERWGAPRASRGEAGAFYTAIMDAVEAKKNSVATPPESPIGSTGSTPAGGLQPSGGLG